MNPHFWLGDDGVIRTVYGCSVNRCRCEVFKMDNLRFLEKESDARE